MKGPPPEFGPLLGIPPSAALNVWRALGEVHERERRVWRRAFHLGAIAGAAIGGVVGALIGLLF